MDCKKKQVVPLFPRIDQLTSSPEKAWLFDLPHLSLQLFHVRLVVPRLDVQNDVGLGNHSGLLNEKYCNYSWVFIVLMGTDRATHSLLF